MDNNDDKTNTFVANRALTLYCLAKSTVVVAAGIAVNKTHTFLHSQFTGNIKNRIKIIQGIMIKR